MLLRVLLLVITSLFWATHAFAAPVQKQFDDWQVTCNNQNFCKARNTGNHDGLVMTLSRSAGAHTDVEMRIEKGNFSQPASDAQPIAPRMLLDDKPFFPTGAKWQITPRRLINNEPLTITAFLAQIQNAKQITLAGGAGKISLAGLKDAVTFIDTQQKRVGNETAWVAKGDEPPLNVPPAPALKAVAVKNPTPTPLSKEELNELLDYGGWQMNNTQCSLDPMRREVRVYALTDDKALMIISCEMGAYNVVDLAWLVERKKPLSSRAVRLRLPFTPANQTNDIELMNATFDERTRELVTLAKGRGKGDCGVSTRWRYDGQRFRLVKYAEEPSCDDWNTPDAWPTLWVTK
ncbi:MULTISPECIES: DUF1176 domain-containing protein [Enterobacteriaceae]|uniref:DUF1176 domain-containing protein n=1 Tax=Atlantibacter subterraneus TaxID=255519 RepID=A0A427UN19_9ENTR|nr:MULTISPECIES: DUF1176 domain-containing protein [Enterobacteriaceae]QFH70456.1 DUF1176 domain-containing protein [Enterobacter sp. E76]MDA3132666.1 DUF1176 domain-containing protein [Atlantibacter subterranea]MDW2743744.1 DUF1176 domain-containing protein [Atlantibacter subterranea]RSB58886.1 DUF1176 domain-containing protein [Atlantibacter subterranea]RSE04806.1 DUF1176 domain-containing protein [Atlantibacter subterranea]